MELRFLMKPLWAAAVVMIAVSVLGQGALAGRSVESCSVTLVCDEDGVVVSDMVLRHQDGVMDVRQDNLQGRSCYQLLRLAASPVGDPPAEIRVSTVEAKSGALFDIYVYDIDNTGACPE